MRRSGISVHPDPFEEDVTEKLLLETVEQLNNDPEIDGFIVQLPLPRTSTSKKSSKPSPPRKMWTASTL
jgi:methylenetetrahydrofolate dehydrogenase (NADP+)/methenyltetrahydrofolate cyclohydrolase